MQYNDTVIGWALNFFFNLLSLQLNRFIKFNQAFGRWFAKREKMSGRVAKSLSKQITGMRVESRLNKKAQDLRNKATTQFVSSGNSNAADRSAVSSASSSRVR